MFLTHTLIRFRTALLAIGLVLPATAAGAAPRIIQSFITDASKAAQARPRSNQVRPGEKIHFYFKVGPLKLKRGKGAPFQTRMVVRVEGKVVKDFGWQNSNAAGKSQMKSNGRLKWYHNLAWNLTIPKKASPGAFEAVVYFRELLTKAELAISFPYRVVAPGQGGSTSPRTSTKARSSAAPKMPLPTRSTVAVSGKVTRGRKGAADTPVRAFLVSDLAAGRVVLVAETRTDARGNYRLNLAPKLLYSIKAGVSETDWRKGKGLHGGTLVDLSFPEDARKADIPLEKAP